MQLKQQSLKRLIKLHYDGFFKLLDLENLHDEFNNSLNGLIKYIGLLHSKKMLENDKLQMQKDAKENKREETRDKRINLAIGILGLIATFVALPGVMDIFDK